MLFINVGMCVLFMNVGSACVRHIENPCVLEYLKSVTKGGECRTEGKIISNW